MDLDLPAWFPMGEGRSENDAGETTAVSYLQRSASPCTGAFPRPRRAAPPPKLPLPSAGPLPHPFPTNIIPSTALHLPCHPPPHTHTSDLLLMRKRLRMAMSLVMCSRSSDVVVHVVVEHAGRAAVGQQVGVPLRRVLPGEGPVLQRGPRVVVLQER